MLKKLCLILTISIITLGLWAADFEEFVQKAQASVTDQEALKKLVQEYLYKAQNLEDHRTLQNYWSHVDKDACLQHYQRLAKANPDNPEFAYLAIRLKEDNLEEARKMISSYPKFYWGYRILAVDFSQNIQDEAYPETDQYKADILLLDQGKKEFPDDGYINLALAYRYKAEEDYLKALNYISELKDISIIQNHFRTIQEICVETKARQTFEKLLFTMISHSAEIGEITQEQAEIYQHMNLLDFIQNTEGTAGVKEYVAQNPKLKEDGEMLVFLADMFVDLDDHSLALEYLESAVNMGASNYPTLANSQQYEPLTQDPKWQALLSKAEADWNSDAQSRAEELLATQTAKPAPDWELKDIHGNTHKLSDLREYVVILDFWAQWCGPCKMAMPGISKWIVNDMPRGVKVFSVNVMENDYDKAKAYFQEQKYAMTYLEGNQDVANSYGVRGIPHITVIDRQGNIAWEQVGFSYDLEEKLSIWVNHLSK